MDARLEELAARVGVALFDYQREYLEAALEMMHAEGHPRTCLYYKTGAGKSLTALASIALWGYHTCVVVAPPSTHQQWLELGMLMHISVAPMSHAKFRMKDTKLSRNVPIIADEMHLFGGQRGQGWRKLDKLAAHLQAPLVLASATPNYNDAERVYCIKHVLNPASCSGGYLQFLYRNCVTEQDPFSMTPKVLGFNNYPNAAAYLADLPGVYYLADDLVYTIEEVPYQENPDKALTTYGYNRQKHKMVGSIIEMAHTIRCQGLMDKHGELHPDIFEQLLKLLDPNARTLVFAQHSTVAVAVASSLCTARYNAAIVTGKTSATEKDRTLTAFRAGLYDILVGTATLATGTDGLDKVCDTLVILDDTSDDALRRQLIGRIMPRGTYVSTNPKRIFRFSPL